MTASVSAWDECRPEHDLERTIGLCDSPFWLELIVRWFWSRTPGR